MKKAIRKKNINAIQNDRNLSSTNEAVIFHPGQFVLLFFSNKPIKKLLKGHELEIHSLHTEGEAEATVYISINEISKEGEPDSYFAMDVHINTSSENEWIRIYDSSTSLNLVDLKIWLFKLLCDKECKSEIINMFPEHYEYSPVSLTA